MIINDTYLITFLVPKVPTYLPTLRLGPVGTYEFNGAIQYYCRYIYRMNNWKIFVERIVLKFELHRSPVLSCIAVSQPQLKIDTMTSVLIHLIMWRVAHIASYLYATAWPCAMALTVLGIVFWTATKETPSTSAYSANGIPKVLKTKTVDVRSRRILKR